MFDRMMDEVIRLYGFEDERTITFCTLCELVEKQVNEQQILIDLVIDYFKTIA